MAINFDLFLNSIFPINETIAGGTAGAEYQYVEDFFKNKKRYDITLDFLNNIYPSDPSACLAMMSPKAFAFFLPAFIKISLENCLDADMIPSSVVWQIKRMIESKNKKLEYILSDYSVKQLNFITLFLQKMKCICTEDFDSFLNKEIEETISLWEAILI